jgi:hypothetical protein
MQTQTGHPKVTALLRTMASDLKAVNAGIAAPQGQEIIVPEPVSEESRADSAAPKKHGLITVLLILIILGIIGYFGYPYLTALMAPEVSVQ